MNKKVAFVSNELGIDVNRLILLVVGGDTTLLPKRNITSLAEYVTCVEEDKVIFYFVKSNGLFSKSYHIVETTEIMYSQIEHAEFGYGSGKILFLQFIINGELNAIVSKQQQQYNNLVTYISKTVDIVDYELYTKFIK